MTSITIMALNYEISEMMCDRPIISGCMGTEYATCRWIYDLHSQFYYGRTQLQCFGFLLGIIHTIMQISVQVSCFDFSNILEICHWINYVTCIMMMAY